MEFSIETVEGARYLVARLALCEPRDSLSGKRTVVCTTGGFVPSGLTHPGLKRPISVSLVATVEKGEGEAR